MKTAKEVVNKIVSESTHGLTQNNEYMEMLVKEYAREACKEQREICAMASETPTKYGIIKNAPKPELK